MKIIDLSVTLDKDASIFPDPKYFPPELTWLYTPDTDYMNIRYSGHVKMHLHTGSHMDTPKHFGFDSCLDDAKLETLCGPCIVVKLPLTEKGPITVEMVESCLPKNVETKGKRLLLMCGYNNLNWGKEDYFKDTAYVSPELAHWIVEKGFVLAALDMLTDGVPELTTHRTLLGNGIYIVECLTNYYAVPDDLKEATLIVAPTPLRGMEAAPVRAFLICDSQIV